MSCPVLKCRYLNEYDMLVCGFGADHKKSTVFIQSMQFKHLGKCQQKSKFYCFGHMSKHFSVVHALVMIES